MAIEREVILTIHDALQQGTDEWLEQRRGMVTASVVGGLLTPTLKVADNDTSRGITAKLVAERITGEVETTFTNDDMMRGIISEPYARETYAAHMQATVTEVGFMQATGPNWTLGFSPDGLVGDDGLIEVKSPRAKNHILTILRDEVPSQYMAQCQAGLFVSRRKWLDFISFHGGLPMYVKRVHPDPAWHAAIEAACIAFEQRATAMEADYAKRAKNMPATERVPDYDTVELKL